MDGKGHQHVVEGGLAGPLEETVLAGSEWEFLNRDNETSVQLGTIDRYGHIQD